MAFYTFKCNSCGHVFEERCTIKEKEEKLISCPECNANELDRIFEGFTVLNGEKNCKADNANCGGCCGKGCPYTK